jgi:hypothetical protein
MRRWLPWLVGAANLALIASMIGLKAALISLAIAAGILAYLLLMAFFFPSLRTLLFGRRVS